MKLSTTLYLPCMLKVRYVCFKVSLCSDPVSLPGCVCVLMRLTTKIRGIFLSRLSKFDPVFCARSLHLEKKNRLFPPPPPSWWESGENNWISHNNGITCHYFHLISVYCSLRLKAIQIQRARLGSTRLQLMKPVNGCLKRYSNMHWTIFASLYRHVFLCCKKTPYDS